MKYHIIISLIFVLASCGSKSLYYEAIGGSYATVELTKKKELIFILSESIYLPKDNSSVRSVCIHCQNCKIEKENGIVKSIIFSLHDCKVIQITSSGRIYSSSNLPFMLDKIRMSDLNRVPVILSYYRETDGTLYLPFNEIGLMKKIEEGTDYNKYGFFTLPYSIEQVDSIQYRYHPACVRAYIREYHWNGSSKE